MRPVKFLAVVLGVVACQSEQAVAPLTSPLADRRVAAAAAAATQSDADAISANIRALHMPYGTLADPGFGSSDPTSPRYSTIVSYNRTGDAAIWTGHYLAAESFRYAVTQSADALDAVRNALNGVQSLVDVTSPLDPDVLARSWLPQKSPYLKKVRDDEGHNGLYPSTYNGVDVYWIGNTSRDQYAGVFFGLATAYDLVPDAALRKQVSDLVTRLLDYLLTHGWSVQMPNGNFSTTFLGRPDQQLTLLQIGRHVRPDKYEAVYTALRRPMRRSSRRRFAPSARTRTEATSNSISITSASSISFGSSRSYRHIGRSTGQRTTNCGSARAHTRTRTST